MFCSFRRISMYTLCGACNVSELYCKGRLLIEAHEREVHYVVCMLNCVLVRMRGFFNRKEQGQHKNAIFLEATLHSLTVFARNNLKS